MTHGEISLGSIMENRSGSQIAPSLSEVETLNEWKPPSSIMDCMQDKYGFPEKTLLNGYVLFARCNPTGIIERGLFKGVSLRSLFFLVLDIRLAQFHLQGSIVTSASPSGNSLISSWCGVGYGGGRTSIRSQTVFDFMDR